jgi:hypothetical protein
LGRGCHTVTGEGLLVSFFKFATAKVQIKLCAYNNFQEKIQKMFVNSISFYVISVFLANFL